MKRRINCIQDRNQNKLLAMPTKREQLISVIKFNMLLAWVFRKQMCVFCFITQSESELGARGRGYEAAL